MTSVSNKVTKTSIHAEMTTREWVMLITLSLLWGGSFFFVEVVITELPSLTTVFLRVLIAALALWIYAAFKGLYPPNNAKIWGMVFILSLIHI